MMRVPVLALPLIAMSLAAQSPVASSAPAEQAQHSPERGGYKPWADWAMRLAPVGAALLIGAVVVASRRKKP
ncbi:hypothetical protein [Novosphingobium sp. M1R2S20]|uniref:MYXO-CTERM domain-containing protein n=1 Tax=Novosphingobium rhizovicinum TaxID=3228928 RepID=A0ABV3RBV0_9SPHN